MTPAMRAILALVRQHGSVTSARVGQETSYASGTIAVALMRLQQRGLLIKTAAKIYRGSGRGSGRTLAIYALTESA